MEIKSLRTFYFRGANIESRDKDNYTPLLVAVAQGNKEATDALLKRDANIRVMDSSDKTAIYIAAEENCLDILDVSIRFCLAVVSPSRS
jgi:ankyrin repeat protein